MCGGDAWMSHPSPRVSHVENLDVVQALVKTALQGDSAAVQHQVERLAVRLSESGDAAAATALRRLSKRATQVQKVAPIDLTMSAATPSETKLRPLRMTTALPVDQGSGAALCEVVFPSREAARPILENQSSAAVDGLLNEWSNRSLLAGAGFPASSSLLLFGPPGTGKTTLAIYLASRLGLPAVVARLDGLISSYLGSTARNLATLFDFVNAHDCVLILDEFDAVAKVRDDPNEVGEIKRVVNAVLQNLDRRIAVGLTIAITNHESLLDAAIWRRFEHQIQLTKPSQPSRLRILRELYRGSEVSTAVQKVVAWASEGRSGADVRALAISTRKNLILYGDQGLTPIQAVRAAASALGKRFNPMLSSDVETEIELARLLSDEAELTGSELGELFGKDRRTIVRWLRDGQASEE